MLLQLPCIIVVEQCVKAGLASPLPHNVFKHYAIASSSALTHPPPPPHTHPHTHRTCTSWLLSSVSRREWQLWHWMPWTHSQVGMNMHADVHVHIDMDISMNFTTLGPWELSMHMYR
jgi:hypothetical protein